MNAAERHQQETEQAWRDLCWADALTVLESIDPDWRDHWPTTELGIDIGLDYYKPTAQEIREALED